MLRLPRRLLSPRAARSYRTAESVRMWSTADHVVLAFRSADTSGADFDEDDGDGWTSALLPLRAEIAMGDLRGLYLGWLCGTQARQLKDQKPALPAGLAAACSPVRPIPRAWSADRIRCHHRAREMPPSCPAAPKGGPGGRKSDFRPFFRPLERSRNTSRTPAMRRTTRRRTPRVRRLRRVRPVAYTQSESRAGHGRERWRVPAVSGRGSRWPCAQRPRQTCQHRAASVPPACPRSQSEFAAFPERSRDVSEAFPGEKCRR
jgi:hypothetical protein